MTQYVTASFDATVREDVGTDDVLGALQELIKLTKDAAGSDWDDPLSIDGEQVSFRHQGQVSDSFDEVFDRAAGELSLLCEEAFETELQTDAGPTASGYTYRVVVGPDQGAIDRFNLQARFAALAEAAGDIYAQSTKRPASDAWWASDARPVGRFAAVLVDESGIATPLMLFNVEGQPRVVRELAAITASGLLAPLATGRDGRPLIVACDPGQSLKPFALSDAHEVLFEVGADQALQRKREAQR